MTQLRFVPATFAASAVFLLSSLASAIVAPGPLPGCGNGPTCAYGFECTVVGTSGCASAAPCAPGASCPAPEPCLDTQELGCTPAHCTADAECSSGMVCHTWTGPCAVTDCACAPDTPDCGCGGTNICITETVSMCTPRYLLPCETAADCGDGFTCDELLTGGCSASGPGGGPTPQPGGAGASPTPPQGTAGTASAPIPVPDCAPPQPSGVSQCVAKQFNCQTSAQCPAGWSCVGQNSPTTSAPACIGDNCASDPVPTPTPAPPKSICQPPYYGVDSSGGLETPTTPTTGTGVGKGGGSAGSGPTGNPGTPETTGDATSHESSACQMGHAPASTGVLSLLAMAGALFGLKRRRSQR